MTEREIFIAALQKEDPAERRAYLDEVCAGLPELRQQVESLLRLHENAGNFLEEPAAASAATRVPQDSVDQASSPGSPGSTIGPYKLVEQIGEGGMGTVWMAQQTEPVKRLVAIKLIKAGMDSRQVIARFEAERQALALMDHPNIARVLEAGTTSAGRPYFVMDLVKGVPITRYCDEHHLTPRERLELFIPVCQAVQHAHQKGIIHRDLKPSNVLVALHDGKPVPKVIDFGVAKAAGQSLTEKTLVTAFGNIVGTLEYMSPEQAEFNQLDIDTRSDIYSLGALLYELLAGSPPFTRKELERAGILEMLRVIREDEPSRPSTKLSTAEGLPTLAADRSTEPAKLTKLVRGELDWIVMKALEKDRSRRYETANGFAMEVQRYLSDEPVMACPPSVGYRLRKAARRNRVPLVAAGFVLAALILGTSVSTWQAFRATQAEALARRRFVAEKEARNLAQVNLEEARRAERQKSEKLALSHFREAQATRWSGRAGRRFDSLELLKLAAEQYRALGQLDEQRTQELRNEAIACLSLADMKPGKTWTPQPGWSYMRWFDPTLQFYAARSAADDHSLQPDRQQGHLSIRRADDDQEVALLPGFGVRVTIARFSPNGRYLAAHYGDQGGQLHDYVWDLSRREPILKLSQGSYDTFTTFSPDSRLVALPRPDHSIQIYELSSGAIWKDLPPGLRVSKGLVSFHPNGRRLAVVSGGTVQLRDLSDGKELATFKHQGGIFSLAWRSDGKMLAAGCYDHDIHLWDTASPAQSYPILGGGLAVERPAPTGALSGPGEVQRQRILKGHFGEVVHLAFSHGGDLLFSRSWDSTDRLWDPMTGQQLVSRPGGVERRPFFGPDDQELDDGWQVATGRECRTFHGHKQRPNWVAICPDGQLRGRLMASVSDEGVKLWDLAATREGDKLLDAALPVGESMAVHFDPSGESLITDGKRVGLQRWPITTDPERGALRVGPPQSLGLSARAPFFGTDPDFALSADARTVAHSPDRGRVLLYDLENPRGKLLVESPRLRHLAFSPDGRWLATGNWQGQGAKVWDARTGKLQADLDLGEPATIPGPWHAKLAFAPDSKWLVTGTVAEYRFWEVGSWQKKHGLRRENAGGKVGCMVFSPEGKILAVLHGMTEVRLVEPATGREFARLPTAGEPYCFSPDGSQLVTHGGTAGAIQVWDLRLIRRQLAEMDLDWDLPAYLSVPDGKWQVMKGPLSVQVLPAEPLSASKELDAQAYLERGILYLKLRQYRDATADFNRAIALDPKLASAYDNLGGALVNQQKLDDAITAFGKAIELDPKSIGVRRARGDLLLRTGRFRDAIADFEAATALAPHDNLLWYQAAALYLYAGDVDRYRRTCRDMLDRFEGEPAENPMIAERTAKTCALAPDSVADFSRVERLAERSVTGTERHQWHRVFILAKGLADYRGGRLEQAVEWLQRFAPKAGGTHYDATAFAALAMAQQRLGRADQARQSLVFASAIIAEKPHEYVSGEFWDWMHAEILFREAEGLMGAVSPEELAAAQRLRWEGDLANPTPEQMVWLAPKLLLADDTDTYRRVCGRLIARFRDTSEPQTAYLVARICTLEPDTVSDPAALVELAERAVRADPRPHCLHLLGLAHYRAGHFDEAITQLDKSIEGKWNANAANWLVLAMVHHRLGRSEEARKWFDQAARWMENPNALRSIHGHDSLACLVLRREAETLLGLRPRPKLEGKKVQGKEN